jgi:Abortive infection C-terminus
MAGLRHKEIMRIVNRYIGVQAGYLGDFSYRTLEDFYPEYCDLDINPWDFSNGTMRQAFIAVLEQSSPDVQAKIVRGVVDKYPVGSSEMRTASLHDDLVARAERLERGGAVPVSGPTMTSDTVRRAIDDAEALLAKGGPTSAVDRVHTALHGHLRYLCDAAGIDNETDDTMAALLKKLRRGHPMLTDLGPRAPDVERVLNASATILDALNPLRNRGSVAHPERGAAGPGRGAAGDQRRAQPPRLPRREARRVTHPATRRKPSSTG